MDDNKQNNQPNIQQPDNAQQNQTQAAPSGNKSNPGQQGPKPVVSLPKGGGAIKSIGEKFETNPVNGTYNMSVPLTISPGRSEFTPQLGLSYNSGGGNSPFGLGWNVGVPSITRKTDKSLPRYVDSEDSDVYILSGAEDLVPYIPKPNETNYPPTNAEYDIKWYRPRTEGLFARIERWTHKTSGRIHWKSVSRENITSIYGLSDDSCVIDPENSRRIFTWNLEKTFDAKGNLMEYGYKKEDNVGIAALDQKRNATQTYLKEVRYGNTEMYGSVNYDTANKWLFRLVFDYGDHDANNPAFDDNLNWPVRQDSFSTFRAGFDIRTYRLCKRVLMFHQFDDDLGTTPVLVKATEFDYDENPFLTQLTKVTHRSYHEGQSETMPPVSFEYTEALTGTRLHKVDPEHLDNMPHGPGSTWQWADLHGEGLQSLLHTSGNAWYIKPNLGDQTMLQEQVVGESPDPQLKLGGMQAVKTAPHVTNQQGMSFHLSDVDSDSQPEIVVNAPQMNGFYSFENEQWQPFQNFQQYPNIDLNNPNTKMMELSGDGLADIIVSHGTFFEIYLSKGKEGYHPAMRIPTASTEEAGAKIVFADAQNSIHLADMTGDGLADIVRIRHNSVCYWPNLGYGKFGPKVVMQNPPMLDSPDMFNSSRVRLADVDGTGTTDIIYFNHKGAQFFKNQAGNRFSEAEIVSGFPRVDNQAQVEVMDLLGNGTSCMVWTSPLPNHTRQMYYIELTSGIKPYMLKSFTNGMGKETKLTYAPSTKFYLQDKANGKPWITKLPFPVQVLTRVETIEHITGTKLVNKFAYHHGHYDTKEREFRGFGMVEQIDAETLTTGVAGIEGNQHPIKTKSWFHTGFYKKRGEISSYFETEYFDGDSDAWKLPDTILPEGTLPSQEAEACRALRGSLLRSEVYSNELDENGNMKEPVPYMVEEKNYQLKLIQPKGINKHAVWLKTEGETLSYHYERDTNDPRIQHSLTLETDAFGNATKSAQVAYPRRDIDGITPEPEQQKFHVIYSEVNFINSELPDNYHIGVPYETRQLEVTGLAPEKPFTISSLKNSIQGATEIDYAATPTSGVQKRCFARQRTYFYNESVTAKLPLGQIASHAMPFVQLQADITEDLLAQIHQTKPEITAALLTDEGKYVHEDAVYWIPSERVAPDAEAFYLPRKKIDPFGNETLLTYDSYSQFPVKITDALGYETTAAYDYRVLQPNEITDPNGNKQAARYNTLGMISAQAVIGAEISTGVYEGDTLDNPTIAYDYNLNNYIDNGLPIYVHVKKRTQHKVDNFEESYVYSGGNGNMVMTKVQAEPDEATPTIARWVGTGRTVYNNKGKVIKQYEPYFSDTHAYETDNIKGVSPIFYYDPLGRNIETVHPDGSVERVAFNPWEQKMYDQNDTVLDANNQWYADAQASSDTAKQRAATLAAAHADTPQVQYLDSLGRPFITEDDNKADGKYRVHQTLDIAGRPTIITDAKNRPMTTNLMGMQQVFKTTNIDSGIRLVLNDVTGKPIYTWDDRGHRLMHTYDELQRPLKVMLTKDSSDYTVEEVEYGTEASKNNIGQVQYTYDQSGKIEIESYDFKGNPLKTIKQFCEEYQNTINWDATPAPTLKTETFIQEITYDALNRPLTQTQPDSSVQINTYNEAGLLETVAKDSVLFVTNINYNEKGQRTAIYYGNNTKTKYEYDTNTFRLTRLLTTRNSGVDILQDISYIYDPVGNIVEMNDSALQTHYFNNSGVPPKGQYEYDALYRLKKATGRELAGLQLPTHDDFVNNLGLPNTSSNAMQNFEQQYTYDELGNIMQMKSVGQWTRDYFYNTNDNKLLGHTDGTTEYTYDAHGNILTMPHLTSMQWDHKDQLMSAGNGTFTSYYVYDASGNRARKVVEKGSVIEERFYVGGYEIYRKTTNGTLDVERETVHISDDQKRIAMVDDDGTTETIRYQIDNHLGSASLELDQNADIISYEEYHPFGTTSYRSGRTETEVSLKRYKYVGKERDEETGLYYYGARYYAAWIGRWTATDPMAGERSWVNPYNYCQNNPINRTDPTGALDEGEPKVIDTKGYKAFAKTNFGAKYIEAYKTGPLKKHNLTFKQKPETTNSMSDSSSIRFVINGKEFSKSKINEGNINSITHFNSYILIHPDNMQIPEGEMAETIGHEVFLHNVHLAFKLNDLLASNMSAKQKFEQYEKIMSSTNFNYKNQYGHELTTIHGDKDHAEYIMGEKGLYNEYMMQLKEVLSPLEYGKAVKESLRQIGSYYKNPVIKWYVKYYNSLNDVPENIRTDYNGKTYNHIEERDPKELVEKYRNQLDNTIK